MSKFKDFWLKKSHDISIQNDLDDVKDGVHELDEKVDQYEDAQGNLKPGVHVDKSMVEWTCPDCGKKATASDVYDEKMCPSCGGKMDKETKKDFKVTGDPNSPNANHGKLLEWVNEHGTPADRKVFSNLDNESHRAQYERMAADDKKKKKGMFPQFQVSKDKNPEADEISDEDLEAAGEYYDRVTGSKKAMGTGFAGSVPNSLLSRQDLEDKEKSAADDASLYELKDDARDSDTKEEKEELTDKIKETQVKRQKATLKDRGVTKSFREVWNILNHHD